MNFGTLLRDLRIQRGLSQYQLSVALNMPQATIAAYETGRNEPSFNVIQKFADYFHVSPYSLIPFGDIFNEEEKAIVGELVLNNEKLSDLVEIAQHFKESDMDTLLAVANALYAKNNGNR